MNDSSSSGTPVIEMLFSLEKHLCDCSRMPLSAAYLRVKVGSWNETQEVTRIVKYTCSFLNGASHYRLFANISKWFQPNALFGFASWSFKAWSKYGIPKSLDFPELLWNVPNFRISLNFRVRRQFKKNLGFFYKCSNDKLGRERFPERTFVFCQVRLGQRVSLTFSKESLLKIVLR